SHLGCTVSLYSVCAAGESVEFVFDGAAQDPLHGVPRSAAAILRRFFSRTGRRRESMTKRFAGVVLPVGCLSPGLLVEDFVERARVGARG
ncbi:MAG: hypothetical protein ACLTUO_04975, partial [Bifidobacterium sp.]